MTGAQRLDRPAFEAVLWHYAPQLAAHGADRVRAHDLVMTAFDRATGRKRRPAPVDIRAEAEKWRQYADFVHQPTDAEIAGRCHLLAAELDEYDRQRAAAGLRQPRRNRKQDHEEAASA